MITVNNVMLAQGLQPADTFGEGVMINLLLHLTNIYVIENNGRFNSLIATLWLRTGGTHLI